MESITLMAAMFITVASWVALTSAEIYTSSFEVHSMVLHEERVLGELKSYIDSQYERLKVLSNFYTDRLREVNLRRHSDLDLQHPNAVYNVIKRYTSIYDPVLDEDIETFGDFLEESGDAFMANADDVKGAKESLLRLQTVYKMKAVDMVKGDYLGHKGPELQPEDAYQIGVTAFSKGLLDEAVEWLLTSLAPHIKSTTDNTSSTTPELSDGAAQALLGRVYVRRGQTDLAKQFLAEAKGFGSTHGDVSALERELNVTWPPHDPQQPDPGTANLSRLCSLENNIYPAEPNSPLSFCRYRAALLPYNVFQEEILSLSPFSSVIYNVVTDQEAEHMKDHVRGRLQRGKIITTKTIVSDIRTTKVAWINDKDSPVAASVAKRIACITGLDTRQRLPDGPSSAEPFQVANYGLGGHYGLHLDLFSSPIQTRDLATAGDRFATFLIYLSDVERGGATVFPITGVSVAPVKNMALFWYNFDTALQEDLRTYHSGCPVVIGQKWISNKWIWTHGNTFRQRCGLTPGASQLDIEADMRRCYTPA